MNGKSIGERDRGRKEIKNKGTRIGRGHNPRIDKSMNATRISTLDKFRVSKKEPKRTSLTNNG